MKVLFDQGTPVPLRRHLHPHSVDTAFERGWSTLTNGELLSAAVQEGYDVFVTTDQQLKHQQNMADLNMGVVVLSSTSWVRIEHRVNEIRLALDSAAEGGFVEVFV